VVDEVAPKRAECFACDKTATHLLYEGTSSSEPDYSVKLCKPHHDIASEYKAPRHSPNNERRDEWLGKATKSDKARELADKVLVPDRDNKFHGRQLRPHERYDDEHAGRQYERSLTRDVKGPHLGR